MSENNIHNTHRYDDIEDIELDNVQSDTIASKKETNQKKNRKPVTVWSELFSYVKIVVLAVLIAFICNRFIIVNAKVPSGSMKDTILEHDRLIGFRLSYLFSEPERGDVVIFKFPDDETQNYIKRVIGLPGDVIEIYGGHVYINGDMLEEPYIREPMITGSEKLTYFVPEGHYFMMGDNRNDSADSRYWVNTFVAKDKILAKAIFKYYSGHITFKTIN